MTNREKHLYETVMNVCDKIVKKELAISEDVVISDMSNFNDQFLTNINTPLYVSNEFELYLSDEDLQIHGITREMCCDILAQCSASVTGYWVNGDLQVIGSKRDPYAFNKFLELFSTIYIEPNHDSLKVLKSIAGV